MQRIVIYLPAIADLDGSIRVRLEKRYPTARIVGSYEPGVIMWQDALKES